MRRLLYVALAVTTGLVLSVGLQSAGASSKFSYTEAVDSPTGNLVVAFDESGQKRFASVTYRLDAAAVARYTDPATGLTVMTSYSPSETITALTPDDKGRVTASLTLDDVPDSGLPCGCARHMEYTEVTLTNISTGHVYRLGPIVT